MQSTIGTRNEAGNKTMCMTHKNDQIWEDRSMSKQTDNYIRKSVVSALKKNREE